MAKLISAKYRSKYANQGVVLPVVGEVTFDTNGVIEVDDDKVDELIHSTQSSLELIRVEEVENNTTVQLSELEEELSKLSSKELLNMVREAELDVAPDKLARMTDKQLIKLLVKKYEEIEQASEQQTESESQESGAISSKEEGDSEKEKKKDDDDLEKEEKWEVKGDFKEEGKSKKEKRP